LLVAALSCAPAALADEVVDTAELHAAIPPQYRYSQFGPLLSAEIGSALSGDHLAGDLGLQTFGVREFNRTSLAFWDAALTGRLGGFANQHPFFFFGGGSFRGSGELGRRIVPQATWSAYLSGRLDGDLTIMATPTTGIGTLNTINNTDGFGGITADLGARFSGGVSYLKDRRSFVVTLFLQESLHAPRTIAPGYAFTEGGLKARYDIADSFTLWVEGVLGTTPAVGNAALNLATRTVDMNVSGQLRKTFHSGLFLGLSVSYGRYVHILNYSGGSTINAAEPPTFLTLAYVGFSFGGSR
jgi:hypothetical protein